MAHSWYGRGTVSYRPVREDVKRFRLCHFSAIFSFWRQFKIVSRHYFVKMLGTLWNVPTNSIHTQSVWWRRQRGAWKNLVVVGDEIVHDDEEAGNWQNWWEIARNLVEIGLLMRRYCSSCGGRTENSEHQTLTKTQSIQNWNNLFNWIDYIELLQWNSMLWQPYFYLHVHRLQHSNHLMDAHWVPSKEQTINPRHSQMLHCKQNPTDCPHLYRLHHWLRFQASQLPSAR